MSCNISSENLNNPLLKELLKKLTGYFQSIGSDFYVIGATARDIILSVIHNQTSARRTADLDIAIAIKDWDKFEQISKGLCEIDGFQKSSKQKHLFLYKHIFKLDIIPFGEVAKADNNIYWPPKEEIAMSVVGFIEVANIAFLRFAHLSIATFAWFIVLCAFIFDTAILFIAFKFLFVAFLLISSLLYISLAIFPTEPPIKISPSTITIITLSKKLKHRLSKRIHQILPYYEISLLYQIYLVLYLCLMKYLQNYHYK